MVVSKWEFKIYIYSKINIYNELKLNNNTSWLKECINIAWNIAHPTLVCSCVTPISPSNDVDVSLTNMELIFVIFFLGRWGQSWSMSSPTLNKETQCSSSNIFHCFLGDGFHDDPSHVPVWTYRPRVPHE